MVTAIKIFLRFIVIVTHVSPKSAVQPFFTPLVKQQHVRHISVKLKFLNEKEVNLMSLTCRIPLEDEEKMKKKKNDEEFSSGKALFLLKLAIFSIK